MLCINFCNFFSKLPNRVATLIFLSFVTSQSLSAQLSYYSKCKPVYVSTASLLQVLTLVKNGSTSIEYIIIDYERFLRLNSACFSEVKFKIYLIGVFQSSKKENISPKSVTVTKAMQMPVVQPELPLTHYVPLFLQNRNGDVRFPVLAHRDAKIEMLTDVFAHVAVSTLQYKEFFQCEWYNSYGI